MNDGAPVMDQRGKCDFGSKVAERIGADLSGGAEEREKSLEELAERGRMAQAARPVDWQAKLAGMDFDARVDATLESFGRRPTFKNILRGVLEYCGEEKPSEEVERYVEGFPEYAANRQSALRYAFFMQRTGALVELAYDAGGNPVEEPGEEESTETPGQEIGGPQDERGSDASEGQGPEEACAEDRIAEYRYITTDVGKKALELSDPLHSLRELLESEGPTRRETYLRILSFCEERRMLAQISELLIGDPGLEIDDRGIVHMQPNAYIGKLDKAGGLSWDNGWILTEGGRQILAEA